MVIQGKNAQQRYTTCKSGEIQDTTFSTLYGRLLGKKTNAFIVDPWLMDRVPVSDGDQRIRGAVRIEVIVGGMLTGQIVATGVRCYSP